MSSLDNLDPSLRPLRVLLAEPIDEDATAVIRMLVGGGSMVTRVRALGELSALLVEPRFDVVLLDLELADACGVEAVRRARALVGDTPVVVLTAAADPVLATACIEAGAEDFVVKSETSGPLLDRAMRHATGRRRAREIDSRLEHSNRLAALGTLAAGIAHEINNPAAVAVMSAGLVDERLADLGRSLRDPGALELIADAREAQSDLMEALDRIRAAIKNVQAFARPQAQQDEVLDVLDVCQRAHRIVASDLRARAQYKERLRATGPVLGDARQLEQVLVNLLINATHAIAAGSPTANTVGVESYEEGKTLVIAVSDSGVGMPTEVVQRIFDPFFTTKSIQSGSGLGLWICSRIVARMGGQIRVTTEPGRGSRFEVVLPLAQAVAVSPRSDGPRTRVLVVDDDAHFRRALVRVLSPRHAVVEAASGAEALNVLRRDPDFDVVLCDVSMPDVDGLGVITAARTASPKLAGRFVMMTGHNRTAEREALVSASGHPLLVKPLDVRALRDLVEKVSAQGRARA